ncbi:Cytidine deaminase [Penicillium citrinum]|uniref:Cytidine deaminase n=2 Tax=Penicillium TaxID=5073 RepID=A0A9W9TL67_PENCI|nr:Cytidine deaminase [Penicillium citrinum]KAJ5226609.1 Cytidine deaminase [Penicillium citrinum]KAJ5569324.1 Cytidine deaminase [Penicillium hetheringtonii]
MPPIPNQISASELEILSSRAISAKESAYCIHSIPSFPRARGPYSKFRVGACILTSSGEYIVGANVENVSFPVGTCAERVAFGTAIVAGHKEFKAIAVASDITPGASPCGMCRQFMREFTNTSFLVYMYDGEGGYKVKSMGELLPDSFSPADLPKIE